MRRFLSLVLLAIALVSFSGSTARADEPSSRGVTDPVRTLNSVLAEDSRQARLWWYGWLGAFTTLTVGQGVIYAVAKDEGFRQDNLVGAVGSTLGIAGMFLHPVKPYDHPHATLSDAELLADRSRREIEGQGWINHALSAAVAAGSGATLWFYYKRPASSVALNVGAGLLIGELQIWSQPTVARDAHRGGFSASRMSVIAGPEAIALQARF